jgi:YHS domain-containing protein
MQKFQKACEDLKPVWRPRFEEFAKQFGDAVKIMPVVSPERREARIVFLTDLATMTLSITISASADASKMVMDYNLLIVPNYFDYERSARLEMPLDKVDKDALGKWLDDRFVSCVKAYLSVQDNEYYLRRALVEDPITKAKFLKDDAVAKLEHNGATVYFSSEQSMKDYKKMHEIAG